MSYPSVPRIGDRTSPSWIRSCPCVRYPRGRDVWLTLALTIEIDRQHQLPLYLQICERFRAAIAAGHLRPGDRVPALRGLATQLNTARGTVEQAYTILVDEGYLQMRGAAGTFVSPSLPISLTRASPPRTGTPPNRPGEPAAPPRASTPALRPLRPLRPLWPSQPRRSRPPTSSRRGAAADRRRAERRAGPLQPGAPALDAFPRKVWHRLVSLRARSGERALLGYPNPAGYRPLRNTSPPI